MSNRRNRRLASVTVMFMVAASGCGGGKSEPAPLGLISLTPADGALDVPRDVQPMALFDQALDAERVAADSAQLLSPLGLPVEVDLEVSGSGLTVRPGAGGLPGGSPFTLKLAPSLGGADGGLLGSAARGSFTTADQHWTGARQLSDPAAASASSPSVAAAGGATVVAWNEVQGGVQVIKVRRQGQGPWRVPETISGGTGDAVNPSVGMDRRGNAVAVWRQAVGAWRVHASHFQASSGTWSEPIPIAAPSGDSLGPVVVMGAEGHAFVAWRQPSGADRVLHGSFYDVATGTWSAAARVDVGSATANSDLPVLTMDASGTATVIWNETVGSRLVLKASRCSQSGCGAPVQIDSPSATGSPYLPVAAIDSQGNVLVAWHQINGPRWGIHASRFSGGEWGGAFQVNAPDAVGDAYVPALAIDPADVATFAWREENGVRSTILARRHDGASFMGTPSQVDDPTATAGAYDPVATVDLAGNVTVIWVQDHGGNHRLLKSNRFNGDGWGPAPSVLDVSTERPFSFSSWRAVTDGSGRVSVVWPAQMSLTPPYRYIVNAQQFE